jgi:hypothetical protein
VDAVLLEIDSAQGLNINLAELSGVGYEESEGTVAQDKSGSDDKMQQRSSEAWGPILVEKRLSKRNCDGKSILEKAQERKRIVNLETGQGKGNSKSYLHPPTLSKPEISNLSSSIGVKLGKDQREAEVAATMIQNSNMNRAEEYTKQCVV